MTRKGSADGDFIFGLCVSGIAGICACFAVYGITNASWNQHCVEAGVGEFVIVDPATGKSEFRFKKPCEENIGND